jgi:hypothetical protein
MEHEVRRAPSCLRTSPKELVRRVEATQRRVKELEKEVETAAGGPRQPAARTSLRGPRGERGEGPRPARGPGRREGLPGLADQFRDKLRPGWWWSGARRTARAGAGGRDQGHRGPGFSAAEAIREVAGWPAGRGEADLASRGDRRSAAGEAGRVGAPDRRARVSARRRSPAYGDASGQPRGEGPRPASNARPAALRTSSAWPGHRRPVPRTWEGADSGHRSPTHVRADAAPRPAAFPQRGRVRRQLWRPRGP